jgi:CHAT domain-containing protein
MRFFMKFPRSAYKAIPLFLSAVSVVPAQIASDLLAKADAFANQGNWFKAAPLYAEAEAAFRKTGATRNALYAKFGRLHRDVESGAYRAVHDEVSRDLADPVVVADSLLRIRALALLGNIDLNVDTRAAVGEWQEVLAIATSISDEKWQNRARGELGLLAGVNGDLAAAAVALQQSIVKAGSLGDVQGQLHFAIWAANGLAQNGRADAALRLLDGATSLAEKSGHGIPLDLYTARINALISLPEDQLSEGRAKARTVLSTALTQARTSGIVVAEGALLNQAGQLEFDAGNIAAAEVAVTKALDIATKANLPREEAEALRRLSGIYRKTHQPAKALAAIDRSITVLQHVEEAYDLPRFVAEKAEVEIDLGNVRAADALYDRASSLIEGLLVNAPSSLVKSSMIAALSEIYIAHFRLAWNRLHDGPKAFQIIENVRGRTLYDSIRYARLTTPTDRQSPQELEIVRLQKSLLHEQLTAQQTRRVLVQLDEAYYRLIPVEYGRVRKEMALRRQPPVSVAAIRRLLGPHESLVEYVFDKEACYALQITQTGLRVHTLPGRAEIGKTAKAFVTAIRNQSDSKASATALYQQVLKPVTPPASSSLVVIPDGSLHLIPFGALVDEQGGYVESRLTISAAPSATIYYTLRTAAKRATPSKPFLGVAYSASETGQPAATKRELADLRAGNLKPLQFGREEISEAAKAMGPGSVTLDGGGSSEAALKSQPLGDFKVLHFAAHGVSSESEPDRAALVLSPGRDSEDGLWQAREIQRTRLNADVVVLSACETGSGRLQGQEGVMNLARSFLTAGAKSVVASLWSVDDRSTATLMEYFYTHLAQGATVSAALRQAQLDFIKNYGEKAKPYLWAGFEVIGDGTRRLKFETNHADLRSTGANFR